MRKGEGDRGTQALRQTGNILLGAGGGLGVSLVVTFLAAVLISAGTLSEGKEAVITAVACFLGSLFGGAVAARDVKGKRFGVSCSVAGGMFALLLLAGVLLYQELASPENWLPAALGCLCGGGLAGILKGKGKKKRRK